MNSNALIWVALSVLSIWPGAIAGADSKDTTVDLEQMPIDVALIKVLSAESWTIGRQIRVFGFLSSLGSPRLFLTRDHAEHVDYSSGVYVFGFDRVTADQEDSCFNRYVWITGVLDSSPVEGFPVIRHVRSIQTSPLEDPCWIKTRVAEPDSIDWDLRPPIPVPTNDEVEAVLKQKGW